MQDRKWVVELVELINKFRTRYNQYVKGKNESENHYAMDMEFKEALNKSGAFEELFNYLMNELRGFEINIGSVWSYYEFQALKKSDQEQIIETRFLKEISDHFLYRLVGKLIISNEEFFSFVVEWIEFLISDEDLIEVSVPILGLHKSVKSFDLTSDIKIIKQPKKLKQGFSYYPQNTQLPQLLPLPPTHILSQKFTKKRGDRDVDPTGSIIVAFQLLSNEWISLGAEIKFKPLSRFHQGWSGYTRNVRKIGPSKYEINDSPTFIENWRTYYEMLHNNALPIWIHRFRNSYHHFSLESSFLDLMMCLESIFSEGSEATTFKIRTRTANLIGRSFEEKKEIRKNVNRLYVLRSNIVHKGVINIVRQDDVTNLRNIVRQCIIKIIELYDEIPNWETEKKDLLDKLDLLEGI